MKSNGFSLFEILITLCLITSTCLALIKQQWQAMRWSNQQLLSWQGQQHLVNACERQKSGLPIQPIPAPFYWQTTEPYHIEWQIYQKRVEQHLDCSQFLTALN
ncbi:hypothetical protein [Legionella sp. W05-934-2]|jgi:Tfp pilus assembly protein PilV|uniref:hypothetical protein n=1 Tax=Legionella sp. W05-934-2 TaxID=1198649 RepID=UPI0034620730